MKRIFLFLITNIAIMVVLSITLRILGVDSLLKENGSSLDIQALVIFSTLLGPKPSISNNLFGVSSMISRIFSPNFLTNFFA